MTGLFATVCVILGFIFIPGGRHGVNLEGWWAVLIGIVGLLLLWWFVRTRKHAERKYEELLTAEAEVKAESSDTYLLAGPDTGGRGLTPTDLRGVAGPSRTKVPADAWLLGLAALHVESWHLDHGSWTLAPEPRDGAWQRQLDILIETMAASSRESWQYFLYHYQESLAEALDADESWLAGQVADLAFWVRVGCAAGHISENDARNLTRSAAARLRGVCPDWDDYAELLQSQSGTSRRGTIALLKEPGWPWYENTWP